jgi:predicted dehydrogenase
MELNGSQTTKGCWRKKPNFVVVSVPTKLHREAAEDAVKKGCHILVDEPIAYTISEAKKIVQTAEKRGV